MRKIKARTENGIKFQDAEINEKNVMAIGHTERCEVAEEEFNCTADLRFHGGAMLTILLPGFEGDPRPEDIIWDAIGALGLDAAAWSLAETEDGLTAIRKDAINFTHGIGTVRGRERRMVSLTDGGRMRIYGELGEAGIGD